LEELKIFIEKIGGKNEKNESIIWIEMNNQYNRDLFILGLKTFNYKS